MIKQLLKYGLLLYFLTKLSGCNTANYTQKEINKVPEPIKKTLQQKDINLSGNRQLVLPTSDGTSLPYEKVLVMDAKYDTLPFMRSNLVFADPNTTNLEARIFDRTTLLNKCFDELLELEYRLPQDPNIFRLNMSGPDPTFVSQRSKDNQLSNACGLLGVETYTTDGFGRFLIDVDEVTGITHGIDARKFDIEITFGKYAFNATQTRTDKLYFVEGAENAAIALAVAGPYGAIGSGFQTAIEGIWGYFEGNNPPNRTHIVQKIRSIDQTGKTADVYSILTNASDMKAKYVVAFEYASGQLAIVHLGDNVSNIKAQGSTLTVTTDLAGVMHLNSAFYRGLLQATRTIPWSTPDPTRKRLYCPEGEGDLDRVGGPINGGLTSGGIVR